MEGLYSIVTLRFTSVGSTGSLSLAPQTTAPQSLQFWDREAQMLLHNRVESLRTRRRRVLNVLTVLCHKRAITVLYAYDGETSTKTRECCGLSDRKELAG